MSITINELQRLLKATNRQFEHQREIARIKGETFNIFSILNLETNEVKTHSRFLAELLNPKGSHLMGSAFLKDFIERIKYKGQLDIDSARVKKEKWIGLKTDTTGGYIDILIKDNLGNTITIENKINAGDQENQILRYCNYNKLKNTVYYITPHGKMPSGDSIRELIPHEDFYLISYSKTILEWLYRCQEIAVNVPQIRESIKQYYLLIKKLTHQMIDPKNVAIKKLLFENAESSQYIADNFQNIKNEIKERFREDVVNQLRERLDNMLFDYAYPNKVSGRGIAQIFVQLKNFREFHFDILIESFSGYSVHGPDMFIGILDHSKKQENFPLSGDINKFDTTYWKAIEYFEINNKRVNMEDNAFLERLVDPESDKYIKTLSVFVDQCVHFISKNYLVIENFFKKNNF